MALQQKIHAQPKRERPETDYEQWMREHDESYELSEEPQYGPSLQQPPAMPDSSSGRVKSVEEDHSHGSHYGTIVTSPAMHSSSSSLSPAHYTGHKAATLGQVMVGILVVFMIVKLLQRVGKRRHRRIVLGEDNVI
jgi:hypothetical protein